MLGSIYHEFLLHYPIAFCFWLIQHLRGRAYAIAPPAALTEWQLTQLFGLLSLVFIFLYNGKKGRTPKSKAGAKAVQLGFYLFYPAHMLLLCALRLLLT